jgi:hypothetical protein
MLLAAMRREFGRRCVFFAASAIVTGAASVGERMHGKVLANAVRVIVVVMTLFMFHSVGGRGNDGLGLQDVGIEPAPDGGKLEA